MVELVRIHSPDRGGVEQHEIGVAPHGNASLDGVDACESCRRRGHPLRQALHAEAPLLAPVHTADRDTCSDAMPPHACTKSPCRCTSRRRRWRVVRRDEIDLAVHESAPQTVAIGSGLIGGAHLKVVAPSRIDLPQTSDSADRFPP